MFEQNQAEKIGLQVNIKRNTNHMITSWFMKTTDSARNHGLIHLQQVVLLGVLFCLMTINPCSSNPKSDIDILLNFRHPAVGRYYISAVLSNESIYLPVTELFALLYVHFEKGITPYSLKGTYMYEPNEWYINPYERKAGIADKRIRLSENDFRIGNAELYVLPEVFLRLFGLHFSIDMQALCVNLRSEGLLPVEYRQTRQQIRRDLQRRQSDSSDYPLLYQRQRKIVDFGMMDYNVGIAGNESLQTINYTFLTGLELLGGETELGLTGFYNNHRYSASNASYFWRYVFDENSYLTSFGAGRLRTTGMLNRRINGFSVSNEPVVPRRIYESIMIDGTTVPDSDVELYVNNQLMDHVKANDAGYYRFDYPLNYGTARISVRVYTPSGEIIVEENQIQIPFSFLPAGVWAYNIQGGFLDEPHNHDEVKNNRVFHGDIAYGISGKVTAKAGLDYCGEKNNTIYYASLSARMKEKYLLNMDAVPGYYFRLAASHNFASRQSVSIRFTHYADQNIFNSFDIDKEINANVYLPFNISELPAGLRFGIDHYIRQDFKAGNYRIDLNTRIRQLNLRINFRERMSRKEQDKRFVHYSIAGLTLNYSLNNRRHLPALMRSLSARAMIQYNPRHKQMINAGVQISRSVLSTGRLQISAEHDFRHGGMLFRGTLSIDLQKFRTSTHFSGQTNNVYQVQHNISGSFGLDSSLPGLVASNRQMVGQGAASVVFFVDDNGNGRYDVGEEIIPVNTINLNHGANMSLGKDSILRIKNLHSYWTYNAEVVQGALKNPQLVPMHQQFAFVADPNVFKQIEIPLYRTGVIEGQVLMGSIHEPQALSGIRLIIEDMGNNQTETIRTFSDGGYYAMGLIPGKYKLTVDPVQLSFLNKQSVPLNLIFEINALAEGHYLEKLNFLLIPDNQKEERIALDAFDYDLEEVMNAKLRMHIGLFVKASNYFDSGLYQEAKETINKAIQLFETDYSVSLKASLLYISGDDSKAFNLWSSVLGRNPDILIPDTELLDKLIKPD